MSDQILVTGLVSRIDFTMLEVLQGTQLTHGGQWIVIDDHRRHFMTTPTFVQLKIGTERDLYPGTEQNDPSQVVGRVLLQNGFSFWQPLFLCQWAERSLYLPVSPRGLPL